MARILITEDDKALARGLDALFKQSGYAVDRAETGADALEMAKDEPYSVIILDVGLPDISGFEVLRRLRASGSRIPVLILTARDALEERVKGLDLGGDDYLLKPFEPQELEARVRALVRRSLGEASPAIQVGSLEWNRASNVCTLDGRPLELRRRELAVLQTLMVNAGKPVLKERLSAEVFSYDDPVGPNALQVYVARLRSKLTPGGPQIRTIRGLGYILET